MGKRDRDAHEDDWAQRRSFQFLFSQHEKLNGRNLADGHWLRRQPRDPPSSGESSSSSESEESSAEADSSDSESQGQARERPLPRAPNSLNPDTFRPSAQVSLDDSDEGLETLAVSWAFASILLHIVDCNSLDFLLHSAYPRKESLCRDHRFRAFTCGVIWILTKTAFDIKQNEPDEAWVGRANKCLEQSSAKRKDQRLRLVFSGILKLLTKRSTAHLETRVAGKQKMQYFLDKYAPANRDEFQRLIDVCRTPSKKRLKVLFDCNELFRTHVMEVLNSGTYLKLYMQSRMRRATKICSLFMLSYQRAPHDLQFQRSYLSECQKSIPWAEAELRIACGLLRSIAAKPENDTSAAQELQGVKLEKARFLVQALEHWVGLLPQRSAN